MNRKVAIVGAILLLIVAFFSFDLDHWLTLDALKASQARFEAVALGLSAAGCRGVLRRLRAGDGAVAAGGGRHDAGGRRAVRPADRHGAGVVRLEHRRDAGVPRVALRAARLGAAPLRRPAEVGQRGHGPGRRVLPVYAAAGADLPVLHRQPRDGPDADPGPHLLLGQPARHAGRHDRVRERRHPAREDRLAVGDSVARTAALVRAARRFSAARQADARPAAAAAASMRSGRSPRTSTATSS